MSFLLNWFRNKKVEVEDNFDKLMDEIILEEYKNGGFKTMTKEERDAKKKLDDNIASRVYVEGLKFKGIVGDLETVVNKLRTELGFTHKEAIKAGNINVAQTAQIERLEKEVSGFKNLLYAHMIRIERLEERTKAKDTINVGVSVHKLVEDYIKNDLFIKDAYIGDSNKPKSYKANPEWERIVNEFSRKHPNNNVAHLLANEPSNEIGSGKFPDNHGKHWKAYQDKLLNEDLSFFIDAMSRKHRRNPSSIAFRIVRQLKYIGIDLT